MEMSAGDFKAKCLRVMETVQAGGEYVVITKYGKPVARLMPLEGDGGRKGVFGALKGTVKINGDIVGPLDEKWNANEA
jgi:prevent-host-death family protein